MKKAAVLLLLAALLLGATGCTDLMMFETLSSEKVELPEPEGNEGMAPWGDSQTDFLEQAEVFYINEDAQMLTQNTITFMLAAEQSKASAVLTKLLAETPDDAVPIAPAGTRLLWTEVTRDIATVNLSLEACAAESGQQVLWMYAAIANTLTALEGIGGVNVLINGRQMAVESLPVGVMRENDGDLAALWAQHQADVERVETQSSMTLTRTALLYFPSSNGDWYVAEARDVNFVGENYATTLLAALSQPAQNEDARPITNAVNALASTPHTALTAEGFRYLDMDFTAEIENILEKAGVGMNELAGALALTMTSFIPELDGVRISIGGIPVQSVSEGNNVKSFADGLIRRTDYQDRIGDVITLYLRADGGGLAVEERVVSPVVSRLPRTLLIELMSGSGGFTSPMPEGVTGDDILGVRIDDGTAYINLSGNFYRLCQNMDVSQERDAVYAMVNTMTELPNVNRVQFYFEGKSAEVLSNAVYLKTMLLRNPGLVRD